MPKTTLTAAAIERLKPPKIGQIDYWDSSIGGSGLRIGANDKRTFNVQSRVLVSGVRREVLIKIGTYPAISLAEANRTRSGMRITSAVDPERTFSKLIVLVAHQ